ncbi:hypothetical protein NDU88_005509 [Pleurodeles waltl]|uniref:Uncharacterized protein n=1 Tax=Pleurodeles waltl TaxID=8319 RepID=A0AAV7UI88_PLEWA|nr:hypothetical protein NDU88_005509 [Pleurodeles waltl]
MHVLRARRRGPPLLKCDADIPFSASRGRRRAAQFHILQFSSLGAVLILYRSNHVPRCSPAQMEQAGRRQVKLRVAPLACAAAVRPEGPESGGRQCVEPKRLELAAPPKHLCQCLI